MLNAISIFSGGAMLDRAVSAALARLGYDVRTILYCDKDKHSQEVIAARIKDGLIDDAPVWPDVTSLDGAALRGIADCIVAGFPCQPFSVAGKRAGLKDARYLFLDILRIADAAGIRLLLLENVFGMLTETVDRETGEHVLAPIGDVQRLLAESCFHARWLCLSANDITDQHGHISPHGRERWFCCAWRELADTERDGLAGTSQRRGDGDISAAQ